MKKGSQENLNGNGLSIGIDTEWVFATLREGDVGNLGNREYKKHIKNTGEL